MSDIVKYSEKTFDDIKHINEYGEEYWLAREFQPVLEYIQWRNFETVISKAKEACVNSGNTVEDHFADVSKMVKAGVAEKPVDDIMLSRYACYLIVMNGDPRKEVIAMGQTYFAIKTRQQEIIENFDSLSEAQKRLAIRNEIKNHNIALADAANKAGVVEPLDYAIFQNYGYKGLYGGMDKNAIHAHKGLKKSQKILDHMGSTELAANLFRATQTEEKLRKDNIKGKENANKTHYEVGAKVRKTIAELGGTMPEDLPTPDINKFETVYKNKYLEPDSDNFYILIDEAHRSQYKSMFIYMKEVLPNATLLAFTGTPLISKSQKNTYKTFGEPIHNYTMRRAIEDGITVPLVYEGRKVKQEEPTLTINNYFDSLTADLPDELKDKLSDKFSKFKAISEARSRINLIGFDIADHFKNYCIPKGLKAMVVCSSRAAAVEMYDVVKGAPGINPRVVITFGDKREGDDDEATLQSLKKIKDYREKMVKPLFGDNDEKYDDHVCEDFKNPEGEINILIVKDKLLTGFDAPVAGVLYLDKSIQQHSLLQAIARVNRVYKDKDFGLIVDYWGVFGKLNSAIDMYDDAESGMNAFKPEEIEGAIFGPIDEKNKLSTAYENLTCLFASVKNSKSSDEWQKSLADEKDRKEFYNRLKEFASLLNLALSNRDIFKEVGFNLIEKYRKEYLFYKKLKDSVMIRYDDELDLSKYEQGIKNLIDTFVNATEIVTVVKPVSIGDEKAMKKLLEKMDSNESRADAIKTRIESKLKQIRYDDPLLFEEFSKKIKKTIDQYNETRDADLYYASMEIMADDFRNGITSQDYPSQISSDSDAKAFYGAVVTKIKSYKDIHVNQQMEEVIASYSFKMKDVVSSNAKRDWKHNEVVHKAIHRGLDDCLFDLFDEIGIAIDKSNIDLLDLIIDEAMKVAVTRY